MTKRSLSKSSIFETIDNCIKLAGDQLDAQLALATDKEEVCMKVYRASIERSVYESLRLTFESEFEEE